MKVENYKSQKNKEIRVKARLILGDSNFVSSENQDDFRKICFKFYSIATKYLQEHLALNLSFSHHEQFLHHEKRSSSGTSNTISNLSLKLTAAVENKHLVAFGTNNTKESICDMICNQWMTYQNEPLPKSYY